MRADRERGGFSISINYLFLLVSVISDVKLSAIELGGLSGWGENLKRFSLCCCYKAWLCEINILMVAL